MNPSFPDWNVGTQLPALTHKNENFGLDGELVELLWENGQVVLHAQNHHNHHPKPGSEQHNNDSRQVNKLVGDQSVTRDTVFSCENPVIDLIQDTETVSWIDCPVDDHFDKEFTCNFLPEFPHSNPMDGLDEPCKSMDHRCSNVNSNPSVPPRYFTFDHSPLEGNTKTAIDPELVKQADIRSSYKGCSIRTRGEVREYSVKTVASSHCGSNQVITDAADTSPVSSCGIGDRGLSADVAKGHVGKVSSPSDKNHTQTLETVITSSSSDGSHSSSGRTWNQSRGISSHKRKSRDAEDSECQSKDAGLQSAPRKKSSLKSRKTRAAEVHNLSERRRRDRINEKMKTLQELLPHSNKTDKASMLDEAIEYMKSLQLQLQMMWMGSGMAPYMFPGVQHCMSRLGVGLGPLPLPHNPMQFPRLPLVNQPSIPNQAAVCQTTMFNKINYPSQLQNPNIPEQYANYMQFHPLQSASQAINLFRFGPRTTTNNQSSAPPVNNGTSYVG